MSSVQELSNPAKILMGQRTESYFYRKCSLCLNTFKWLPVLFIFSILFWSYYAYVIELCSYNMDIVVVQSFSIILFNLLFLMTIWSYYQAVFTKSGVVPKKFWFTVQDGENIIKEPNEQNRNQIIQAIAMERGLPIICRNYSGSLRICEKCNLIKPDRTHHCSVCKKCILKMDHHCPWINNCVSFTNYKYFILFLGYSFTLCFYTVITTFNYFLKFWRNELSSSGFHIIFLFFIAVTFAISLVSLFGYHIYLVTHNRSTLESFRAPVFRFGPDKNGFNLGKYNNCTQVFGKSKWKWFFPIKTSKASGLVFDNRFNIRFDEEAANPLLNNFDYEDVDNDDGNNDDHFQENISFQDKGVDENEESKASKFEFNQFFSISIG